MEKAPEHTTYKTELVGSFTKAIPFLSEQECIDQIDFYRSDTLRPHWCLVSRGLSKRKIHDEQGNEVPLKTEFTIRILRTDTQPQPHQWPVRLFMQLGTMLTSGEYIPAYDYVTLNGTLDADEANAYVAVLLVPDEAFTQAMNDRSTLYMQIVPILQSELDRVIQWSKVVRDDTSLNEYNAKVQSLINEIKNAETSLLITDLNRT